MKLSIIIPAYNEAATIAHVVDAVLAVPLFVEKEIIVVDDGSTDGTSEAISGREGVTVVSHEHNKGKGAAIVTGLSLSHGDYVLIQDADLEYNPSDITGLVSFILTDKNKTLGNMAVFGARGTKAYPERGIHYVIGAKLLTWTVNVLFGSNLTDLYTGYKLIPTATMKELHLTASGFEFEAEVVCKLLKKGCNIIETPIQYKPRNAAHGKKIKLKDAYKGFTTIIGERFR